MNYKVYKLEFQGAVHFGKKSLEDTEITFCADTLFSALCQEALKNGQDQLDAFYHYAVSGQLLLSDAFPFVGNTCFLPKPMLRMKREEQTGDSVIKKAYKKLKFIQAEALSDYLDGKYDVLHAPDLNRDLGHTLVKTLASVRGENETVPYRMETYYFNPGNGLYVIVGYETEPILRFFEELLDNLSFSGIGGKRASGLGRFTLYPGKLSADLQERLSSNGSKYMTLSVSLPRDDELDAVLEDAEYLLYKRSGFVSSDTYATSYMRKKDIYVLKAGACVKQTFEGDIYDVSGGKGMHPVYRYAKPMFLEVER